MKKLIAIIIVALALAACADDPNVTDMSEGLSNDIFVVQQIALNDGRIIECIGFSFGYQAGIDCNWK